VPADGGSVLSTAAGRSTALKLAAGQIRDSIMIFEETASAGTKTTFHLHRDSDEVAYVLSGEISFKTGDERWSAVPAPAPSYYAASHMPGKTPASKLVACCSSIPRRGRRPAGFSRNGWRGRPGRSMDLRPMKSAGATGWEFVGPPPF
jgi:uncharacterized RmlC-like cupin family protein